MRRAVLLLVFALGSAGCLSVPPSNESAAGAETRDTLRVGSLFAGEGCALAGAVSINPLPPGVQGAVEGVPEPFEPGDTAEYTGRGFPPTGRAIGTAHLALSCADSSGGFVGLVVKPPPFASVEPVERNYLVSGLVIDDAAVAEGLHREGVHVMAGEGQVRVMGESAQGWGGEAILRTEGDGLFETRLLVEHKGPAWPVLRLWFVIEGEDGAHRPAALDLLVEGGELALGGSVFSHSGTDAHPGGRVDVPSPALGMRDFAFTSAFRVLPETVAHAYEH